jgi:hypothetical protein
MDLYVTATVMKNNVFTYQLVEETYLTVIYLFIYYTVLEPSVYNMRGSGNIYVGNTRVKINIIQPVKL